MKFKGVVQQTIIECFSTRLKILQWGLFIAAHCMTVKDYQNWLTVDEVITIINAIFAKVARIASDEVVAQLFKSKRLPMLYYGLEVCRFNNLTSPRLMLFSSS